MFIGCHLSSSNGFLAMGEVATSIGANTFQFFTRNPRGSKAKPLDEEDIKAFLAYKEAHHFGTLLAHAPYTINPCSKDDSTREFALLTMQDDLSRLEVLPGTLYNFHPGSHTGQGVETGIEEIAEILNAILSPSIHTTVLLETMAGKGSEVGSTFEELRAILDKVKCLDKMGVCLDTCHVSDAGYDIAHHLEDVLADFDKIIGLSYLKAIHINDSLNPVGAHKDRHQKIGEGFLGEAFFHEIVHHPKLQNLPFILETPNELDGYAREIALLKE